VFALFRCWITRIPLTASSVFDGRSVFPQFAFRNPKSAFASLPRILDPQRAPHAHYGCPVPSQLRICHYH